jgi:hypothetical protein
MGCRGLNYGREALAHATTTGGAIHTAEEQLDLGREPVGDPLFFFKAEIAAIQTCSGQKPGRKPGGAAGGGALIYRQSSPGPGTSYVPGGSPPDLVWVA